MKIIWEHVFVTCMGTTYLTRQAESPIELVSTRIDVPYYLSDTVILLEGVF